MHMNNTGRSCGRAGPVCAAMRVVGAGKVGRAGPGRGPGTCGQGQ